jgi:hypothetical protein
MTLKMKGQKGSPCLNRRIRETLVFDPLYSIVLLRSLYECIIDSRIPIRESQAFRRCLNGLLRYRVEGLGNIQLNSNKSITKFCSLNCFI